MRKRLGILICLAGPMAVAFLFLWPLPGYEITRVDPSLRTLQQPYRSVKTAYYMDGGSIGIEIVDRDGQRKQFAIPAHLGDSNRYSRVFVGGMHDHKPGAVEISNPEDSKRMLICILQDYPNRTAWDDYALMALRRRPVDFVRCLVHTWRGDYKL